MDFSTLQGVTIPEGVVTKITNASGAVLWSAKRSATVTITSTCVGINGDTARITITSPEPFTPDASNPSYTTTTWTAEVWEEPNCTIEIPIGSTIECTVSRTKGNADSYISLNGTNVLVEGTYIYTVTGNVAIDVSDRYSMGEYGVITIAEEGK